jgi:hypothetical protein
MNVCLLRECVSSGWGGEDKPDRGWQGENGIEEKKAAGRSRGSARRFGDSYYRMWGNYCGLVDWPVLAPWPPVVLFGGTVVAEPLGGTTPVEGAGTVLAGGTAPVEGGGTVLPGGTTPLEGGGTMFDGGTTPVEGTSPVVELPPDILPVLPTELLGPVPAAPPLVVPLELPLVVEPLPVDEPGPKELAPPETEPLAEPAVLPPLPPFADAPPEAPAASPAAAMR